MIKATIHAGRKEPPKALPAVKSTMRIPREPGIIAPILARGEGEAAADAIAFERECETEVDEAEAIRDLPMED